MKKEDLRIGNLLTDNTGKEVQVLAIAINNLRVSGTHAIEYENVTGIPLTPEWLERFGFENDSYANFSKKIADYAYLVISFKDYACAQICENPSIADHDIDAPCKYVHQLQNLIFALTGEELTL